ncbi:hypothetical protein BpHYR1_003300 [Brachionus plicatilis]|uniref:Uncharacterized protein n=1 Tax=Brachionus plicatilis TaxID=10195 RepID=A0A3M7T176_BRAPC|nr:hypothetical protein BpHYR1_003300 [Brachionus plicatilis]
MKKLINGILIGAIMRKTYEKFKFCDPILENDICYSDATASLAPWVSFHKKNKIKIIMILLNRKEISVKKFIDIN